MSINPALHWTPRQFPPKIILKGKYVTLEPINSSHAHELYQLNHNSESDQRLWDYMPYGPFTQDQFINWVDQISQQQDPQFYAILSNQTQKPVGFMSYLRITPKDGVIEVGNIAYSHLMQRSPSSTEAAYLLIKNAFDLGYRRVEWKCNALNERSKAAALRLGFTYEGTFRKHMVVKDMNRDTAWFSIIDEDWPKCHTALEKWLDAENFSSDGVQVRKLKEFR